MKSVSSNEVIEKFALTHKTKDSLGRWQRRRKIVADVVLQHTSKHANNIAVERIDRIIAEIAQDSKKHALRNISKASAQKSEGLRDWNPNFAFTHVFHLLLEEKGDLFHFDEFRKSDAASKYLYGDARMAIAGSMAKDDISYQQARDAATWRVGNAYYAFLKEQHLIASLRGRGVSVEQHPLADALFRVDFWFGEHIFCLYVRNDKFRDRQEGRKLLIEELYKCDSCGGPKFHCHHVSLETRRVHGVVHLPSQSDVDAIVQIAEKGSNLDLCKCG